LKLFEFLEKYDIFVSYHKGPQDEELALAMFTMLSNFSCGVQSRAVEVFLDEKRLQHGKRSQDGLVQSIVNSTIVVPIFSIDALAKIKAHDPFDIDSVLLEWICAIEGYKSDYSRIKYIYPLFRGKEDPVTGKVGSVFDCEEFKQIPDIIPKATLSAAESLLIENKIILRTPAGFADKTVKSIVTDISKFKGLSVDDDKQMNFLTRCAENLIKTLDNHLSKPSTTDPDVSKMSEVEVRIFDVIKSTCDYNRCTIMYVMTYFYYRLSIVYFGNNCCFGSSDLIYLYVFSQYYVVFSHLFNYSSYV
jgi:hypothetical protein